MTRPNNNRRDAALKARRTRRTRGRGRPRLPRVVHQVEVCFPLRPPVIPMRVTVDFEGQVIRFKAPGERSLGLAFWLVYESAGGRL
jgi:hypothetical protein